MVILKTLLGPSTHFSLLHPIQSLKATLLMAAIEAKSNRSETLMVLTHNRAEFQKGVVLAILASVIAFVLGSLVLPSLSSEFVGVSCVMLFYGLYLQAKVNFVAYQQRLLWTLDTRLALEQAGPRSSVKYFVKRGAEDDGFITHAEFQAAMLLHRQGRIWEPGKVKISRKGIIA